MKRGLFDWAGCILWALLIAIALFAATKHLWFDGLSQGDKALFWTNVAVAAGTLALAIVTVASVLETKAVIRGEDRRHQQTFAPFLVMLDSFNHGEDYRAGYTLRNQGYGMALDITVNVDATVELQKLTLPPEAATGKYIPPEQQAAFYQEHTARETRRLNDKYERSALQIDATDDLPQSVLTERDGVVTDLSYEDCSIEYFDMFGNRYETKYTDDRLGTFEWIQPESLRKGRQRNTF